MDRLNPQYQEALRKAEKFVQEVLADRPGRALDAGAIKRVAQRIVVAIPPYYDHGEECGGPVMEELVEKINKVAAWLDGLAKQADREEQQNRGRFDHLADACRADAKNYRSTAADMRKPLVNLPYRTMEEQ